MISYSYRALTRDGRVCSGEIEADGETDAVAAARDRVRQKLGEVPVSLYVLALPRAEEEGAAA